jgi:hypothetical protein
MVAFEYCPHCNESIRWKCSICSKENDKSVHTHYIEEEEKFIKKASETAGAAVITFVSGLSSLILIA